MPPELTVIVAHVDPAVSPVRCIAAADRACHDLDAEIVVVQTEACPAHASPVSRTPVTTLRVSTAAVVPQLWRIGLAASTGEYVAFTLANCEASADWAHELLDALRNGAAGVAGPIDLAPAAGIVDRGVYYLRYSAFTPARVVDGDVRGEIPGDNAAYARRALERHADVIADGFWEVLFHRQLRREGGRLCTRRAASARFFGGLRLRSVMRHRFAHGRHFGAWRVAEKQRQAWQICLAAPAVPLLLGMRAASRVFGSASERSRFLFSLPIFLLVATAWALGEAVGAVRGPGLPSVLTWDGDNRIDVRRFTAARATRVKDGRS